MDRKFNDLTGQIFNKLTVIKRVDNIIYDKPCVAYLCKCNCGKEKIIAAKSLKSGLTTSCGCVQKEITSNHFKKHGLTGSKEHNIWKSMIQRCHNKNNSKFKYYGERGITVCDEWRNSFEKFLLDMGNKPINKSLDRIDNDKGYFKENCKWATLVQQMNNRRNNRMLTLNNKTQNLQQWSIELNIDHRILRKRLRDGWSDEDILTNKIIKHGYTRNKIPTNTI